MISGDFFRFGPFSVHNVRWKAMESFLEAPHTEKSIENLNSFSCFNYDTTSPSLTSPIIREFQRIRGKNQISSSGHPCCPSHLVSKQDSPHDEENPRNAFRQADMATVGQLIDFKHFKVDFIFPLKSKIAYIAYLKKGGGFRKKKIYSTPTPGFTFH